MRRVVVTGMASSRPSATIRRKCWPRCARPSPAISYAQDFAEHGFRSRVAGVPTLDPATVLDRRAMRFHGGGSAWNQVAMEQAIRDAGLEEKEISHERTGNRHWARRSFDPGADRRL